MIETRARIRQLIAEDTALQASISWLSVGLTVQQQPSPPLSPASPTRDGKSIDSLSAASQVTAATARLEAVRSQLRREASALRGLWVEWWKYFFDAANCSLELIRPNDDTDSRLRWTPPQWWTPASGLLSALFASRRVWRLARRQSARLSTASD
jgi:hypothetical protein